MEINGEALRVIRMRSGWSVTKLADAVDVTPGHISNLEAGRRQASPGLIRLLADTLDVPLAALISRHEPEEVA